MTKTEAHAAVRAVRRTCRGPLSAAGRKVVNALLSDGRATEAKQADAAGRKRCGADFNDIVLAGPLDGKRHEYTCPKCGVTGTYTAPLFTVEG